MIEVQGLVKRYGSAKAVDNLSFTVKPGQVTGFLGPNGAGKSTTMRLILGLAQPDAGQALVNGRLLRDSAAPIAEVCALIDGRAFDRGRSARAHLRAVAATIGIANARVDEVLEFVGLTSVANKNEGGFSLGMGQRLGIATALLADPQIIMLDEPINGLDLDGIAWIRKLLRKLADEGRTVFISSHLMSEMEIIADHLIVVGRGKVLADTTLEEFTASSGARVVMVETPEAPRLARQISAPGVEVESLDSTTLKITGLSGRQVGEAAAKAQVTLHQLTDQRPSLEEAYARLTSDAVQFRARVA